MYEKEHTCFSKEALQRIGEAWNSTYPDQKIKKLRQMSKKALWSAINERMHDICKGDGKEWCWIDSLQKAKSTPEVMKSVRPVKPREWYRQPYAWLSNFDIEAVMRQYQEERGYKYKFLGVYPIDFGAKNIFGQCLFSEICNLDIQKFAKKGAKYLGMITNLDRHDQSGSHWTSLFMCIDPKMPCFGAYYYDSVANRPPKEIVEFARMIKTQAESYAMSLGVPRKFELDYNKVQHQKGNSECGVFSMVYQIRWLRKLRKSDATIFKDVVDIRLNDEDVHEMRNVLFRPNTKEEVGRKDAKAPAKMT